MGGLLKPALAIVFAFVVALGVSCSETRYTMPSVDTSYEKIDVTTDTPATVLIPNDWAHVSHPGHNAELGIAASPDKELVAEVVVGNGASSMSNNEDLEADDVFLEVWASYQPFVGAKQIRLLPKRFDPESFEAAESVLGSPVYELKARGEGIYDIRYWIGPDASDEDREALLTALGSLRFQTT